MNISNIQTVTNIKTHNVSVQKQNHSNNLQQDTIQFKGLNTALKKGVNANVKRVPELKQIFTDLFNAVDTNPEIQKTNHYETISNLIKENGFFRTLTQLCDPNPKGKIRTLVELADESPITLATLSYASPIASSIVSPIIS